MSNLTGSGVFPKWSSRFSQPATYLNYFVIDVAFTPRKAGTMVERERKGRFKRRHVPVIVLGVLMLCCIAWLSNATALWSKFLHAPERGSAKVRSLPYRLPQSFSKSSSLTVVACPAPFLAESKAPQLSAIRSWLALTPPPKVVLIGNHSSFYELAKESPGLVSVEPQVDRNYHGSVLLNSMIARAQAASTEWAMVVTADTILMPTLFSAAHQTIVSRFEKNASLFLSASSFQLAEPGQRGLLQWALGRRELSQDKGVKWRASVLESGKPAAGPDLFLWNKPAEALHRGATPPFAVSACGPFSPWLVDEVLKDGLRQVVDISNVAAAIRAPYAVARFRQVAGEVSKEGEGQLRAWNQTGAGISSQEVVLNAVMGGHNDSNATTATPQFQVEDQSWTKWRLDICHSDSRTCLVQTKVSTSAMGWERQDEERERLTESLQRVVDPAQLLPALADEDNAVILLAVTNPYFDMLMNFVCRMRALRIPPPLVAALDEAVYDRALRNGLAVYLETGSATKPKAKPGSGAVKCDWGTVCFAQHSKRKSRTVLRILKLGYSVVWTDVDIWWFQDARPGLKAFGPGVLPIQSEEVNHKLPANNGVNSGLYYARAEPRVVEVIEKIVRRAEQSPPKKSEQPSFLEELCGEKLERRRGNNECYHPNGLNITLLNRELHPNGYFYNLWESGKAQETCKALNCETIHNNWIMGLQNKVHRFMRYSMWIYDEELNMCISDWNRHRQRTWNPPPQSPSTATAAR